MFFVQQDIRSHRQPTALLGTPLSDVSYGTLNIERINKKEDSYSTDYLYRYNV